MVSTKSFVTFSRKYRQFLFDFFMYQKIATFFIYSSSKPKLSGLTKHIEPKIRFKFWPNTSTGRGSLRLRSFLLKMSGPHWTWMGEGLGDKTAVRLDVVVFACGKTC